MPYIKLDQVNKLKRMAKIIEASEWISFNSPAKEMRVAEQMRVKVSRGLRNLYTELNIARVNKNDKEKFNSKFRYLERELNATI